MKFRAHFCIFLLSSCILPVLLVAEDTGADQTRVELGDAMPVKRVDLQDEHFDWDLVIVIPTHISEFSRRCSVRDGWARQLRGHEQGNAAGRRSIKLMFTVGVHYADVETEKTAKAEREQFGDMYSLPSSFEDKYSALGTKVRLSFKEAVDSVGKFRLVLKTDTDSFVHVDRLLDFLDRESMWTGESVYAGSFRNAAVMWEPEHSEHKWFDGGFTEMTGLTQYPWNAQGGGYLLSWSLASYLAHPPVTLKAWSHEDVGVGAWLMAIDHRRVDMPVGFAEPECGCGVQCTRGSNDPDMVIDHYVSEYLHRWRQRRFELFGDACWTPGDSELPLDLLKGDDRCYAPTVMGALKRKYSFSPLQSYGHALLPDHSDTRSGVCAFTFERVEGDAKTFLGLGADRCVSCRGSDGNYYDEFECASSETLPSAGDFTRLVDTQCSGGLVLERESLSLDQCQELGRFSMDFLVGWERPTVSSTVGSCRLYNAERCSRLSAPGIVEELYYRLDRSISPVQSSEAFTQQQRNLQSLAVVDLWTGAFLLSVASALAAFGLYVLPRIGVLLCPPYGKRV